MHFNPKYNPKNWWHWVVGPLALLWLVARSGADPKRLTYPCQRAAMPLASTWLISVAAFFAGSLLLKRVAKLGTMVIVLMGAIWLIAGSPEVSQSEERSWERSTVAPPPVWEADDPISKVIVLDEIAPSLVSLDAGDASVPEANLSDPVMAELMNVMTVEGIHLYRTSAHPDGVVGADNIVIIKGNYQWTAQNTTCNDRVKGLIWLILNHPDEFTGEIIVADNTQDHGTGINSSDNNSDDPAQSIVDVVATFFDKGYPVYLLDWLTIFDDVANEYDQGDYSNGYLYDPTTHVTYPKFLSPSGSYYISAAKGVWDPQSLTYDSSKLCIVNFPVLKAHWRLGATVAVKNWVGMGTIAYYNERYGGIDPLHDVLYVGPYALVARIMEQTFPRLSIVDATWTSCTGPLYLDTLVRTNMILASTDPVAISWYAAKHILTPIAYNPITETDPDDPRSRYHECFTNWAAYLADSAGLPCTRDSSEMTVTDGGVNFHADTVVGWAPLEVTFEGTSSLTVDSWDWDFGDGAVGTGPSENHIYDVGGLYDVSLSIDAGDDTRTRTRRHYVVVLADTVFGEVVEINEAGDVAFTVIGKNHAPVDEILLPCEYSGDLSLQYDSFSVAGCRTATFDQNLMLHQSASTKRFTLRLRASSDGYPGLTPGEGPIVKFYFHTTGAPDVGDSTVIYLDGYEQGSIQRLPTFAGVMAEYEPGSRPGTVLIVDCCQGGRGNVDSDPDDIVDISDLVYLVDYMFASGAEPLCWKEANIDGDLIGDYFHQIDIADLVYLVDYMFNGTSPPPSCSNND